LFFVLSALSDEFGRKPLILLPLVGLLLGYLLNTVHVVFVDRLPVEFILTDSVAAFFGGMPIYYLGIYSYCTSATRCQFIKKAFCDFGFLIFVHLYV
jgi:hypothetical protein